MNDIQYQEEYIRFLIQNIDIRKEIKEISEEVLSLIELNEEDKKNILTLNQTLKEFEKELKANKRASTSIANFTQMTNSLCGDSSTIRSINQQITLKKLPKKELETENSGNFFDMNSCEGQNLKLFEHFLVIGVNPEKVKASVTLTPDVLFSYPDPSFKDSEYSDIIKNLAFP